MDNFRNILFVTQPNDNPAEGLKQAIGLARSNHAALKVLVAASKLPEKLDSYNEAYLKNLKENAEENISKALAATSQGDAPEIEVVVEPMKKFAVEVIQYVLRHGHDLLVKHAESGADKGFKAPDMALLRKCPCPVWLWRAARHAQNNLCIGVAVDAQSDEQEGKDLAKRLVQVADSLSAKSTQPLKAVSCWEYEFEGYLRENAWIKIPEEEINEAVEQTKAQHKADFDALMNDAGVTGEKHQLRGTPAEVLPDFVNAEGIDVLVMGTVGRTGIPGFIIGNTAEALLQEVKCSLLAMKPAGFTSPVNPY